MFVLVFANFSAISMFDLCRAFGVMIHFTSQQLIPYSKYAKVFNSFALNDFFTIRGVEYLLVTQ